ncbi:hypothetical protein CLUG_04410 [Clavispora lusitaniae ATCC 42720]|uniref:Uncharacterized protein n=1 Tax=Clavispora lusitaniae (strain ATCC 42720) TaxID=306902 RepID=C4Y882_CLAL4|nr:uncharacterized protein CLUG_04410 [Clavispora lusitaniae ATCC 42720]EEQ40281.1 hypothetical protein CLUG_04410 [Clavispora lusitaniae ATCC 42720]
MAIPVNLPFNSGITLPTALAAPVEDGMMLPEAVLPPLQSLWDGPSTVFWVAVMEWTVVIKPSSMPKVSLITLANGAKQLVVQGGVGNNVSASVLVFVDTNNEHWGVSRRSSDDNLLGTSVNVLSGTFELGEDTSGVDDQLDTLLAPWNSG